MLIARQPTTLSQQQVDFFWQNGYVVLEDAVDRRRIEHLRATLSDLINRDPSRRTPDFVVDRNSATALRNVNHFTRYWIAGTELIRSPRVLGGLRDLLGDDVRFHHSKVMLKRAREGTPILWHQDLASFVDDAERDRLVALGPDLTAEDCPVIAVQHYLDDGTRENGCICFVPGSHRRGLLPPSRSPGRDQPDFFGADKVVEVPVPAGSAAFFHAMTLHFSGPNNSPRPRRCPIVQYFAPPTRFRLASGDDQPDLPYGERLVAG